LNIFPNEDTPLLPNLWRQICNSEPQNTLHAMQRLSFVFLIRSMSMGTFPLVWIHRV